MRFTLFLTLLILCNCSLVHSFNPTNYNITDPKGDHTNAGKYFDRDGKMTQSIQSFRAACLYNNEPTNWIDLGTILISHKRTVDRETALLEGLDAFEHALWYDRDHNVAWTNVERVQTELRRYEWSGESGRKRFLKKGLAASSSASSTLKEQFPNNLKSIIELSTENDFWNFLSSKLFKLKYFEQWPVLIKGSRNMFGEHYYSMKQMLNSWFKMGNGGYTPPYRNLNFLRGSLAKKTTVHGLPTWFTARTGMIDALRRGYNVSLCVLLKFICFVLHLLPYIYTSIYIEATCVLFVDSIYIHVNLTYMNFHHWYPTNIYILLSILHIYELSSLDTSFFYFFSINQHTAMVICCF